MSAYAYYPGCSLHGTAREYAASTERVCHHLDIDLVELADWNCCGASSAHMTNPWLALGLVGRNLRMAAETGLGELVLPCAACYARFKDAQQALSDPEVAADAAYVVSNAVPSDIMITPLLGLLRQAEHLSRLRQAVRRPLDGLKVAAYYGCLLVRPPDVTGFDDPEAPQALDEILRTLGVEPVAWPGATACCGGSLAVSRPDLVQGLCHQLLAWATEAGAAAIVTACPMCHSNLDTRQSQIRRAGWGDHHLPIYYFTELMGYALGDDPRSLGIHRHVTESVSLLQRLPAGA